MSNLLTEFEQCLQKNLAPVRELDEMAWRQQYHPDLSPIGWHLGHSVFIENYWIHEVVLKDDKRTRSVRNLYFPELCAKATRASRIPCKDKLITTLEAEHAENTSILADLLTKSAVHPLLENHYLLYFLIQHHAQHGEILRQILSLRALAHCPSPGPTSHTMTPEDSPNEKTLAFDEHETYIGSNQHPAAYDNECTRHATPLKPYAIAAEPVGNAAYLDFMTSGGYQDASLWTKEGWRWQQQHRAKAPLHWRQSKQGDWCHVTLQHVEAIDPKAPVYGINYHEASAYARYAGARLPTETEWEHACINSDKFNKGSAWEWCANAFYPYPEFKPFPYEGYSMPWFDGQHYALRGGSMHTSTHLKRPTFRNFYTPDKRHVFAGVRLAYDI